jgi:SAM-dependent methyltransferase
MSTAAARKRSGGYDPEHYCNLAAIEDRHFWFRSRNEAIRALAGQVCAGFEPGYRALEIGCGTGNVLRHLEEICRGGSVIGMDLFGQGFQFARQRSSCGLVQGDASRPPFVCPFHLIGMFDVMEHVPNDVALLGDAHRLLAPGGALLVTVPAHMSLWSYFDEASNHCRRYELGELRTRLSEAGFAIEFLSEYMCSVTPLVWLKRRLLAQNQDGATRRADVVKDELAIYPVVNGVLAFLLKQEARWLRMRKRLPFGASLIAIARKPAA